MINYIIQVILFQVLFLAVYDFFLSKETFFSKNRWYLLGTSLVSFVLPFLKLPRLQKAVPQEYTILLPEVVLSPQTVIEKSTWYQSINYLDVFFYVGVAVFSLVFTVKLIRIIRLILTYGRIKKKDYTLVLLPKNSKAFSFFNYIFLGKEIPKEKQAKIIQHELVHSKQKHSLDLLLFEFLKIFMWFNPMLYVYQHRISLVHEYISDEVVAKSTPKESYINNLLSEIFQVEHISFINQFYKHSLIKKRIIMMTKNKSKQIKQLKYLLLVPVLASMVLYTSCNEGEKTIGANKELVTHYNSKENKITSIKGSKETYFDTYFGKEIDLGKELSIDDLSAEERNEFLFIKNEITSKGADRIMKPRIFKGFNDRRIIGYFFDFKDSKEQTAFNKDNVPFSALDKVPTFPGCADGDKTCLNMSMQKFIVDNFNGKIANELGLQSGKKRIYVQFKIGKDGSIKDVKARAPHPKLKEHAMSIVNKLPTMKPGEKDGKVVTTGYTLPITFMVQ